MEYAELYYSCLAYASGEPKACAPLESFEVRIDYGPGGKGPPNPPASYAVLCRENLYDLQMSRADIARDDRAMAKACELHEAEGHDFRDGLSVKACATLAQRSGDPKTACAELAPWFADEDRKRFCIKEIRYLGGDPSLCPSLGSEMVAQEICEANSAFRKALLLGDPARCGDSVLCRVHMSGGARLCAPYEQKARLLACRASGTCPVGAAIDDAYLRQVDERLAQADVFLERLESRRGCESAISVGGLIHDWKTGLRGPLADELFMDLEPDLERYSLCRSYADGDPKFCGELEAFEAVIPREKGVPAIPFDLLCRTLYYEAAIAKAMAARSSKAASLCVTRNEIGDRDFKLDSLSRSCGIVAEFSGSTTATCGRLTPFFDNASIAKTCPKMLRFVTGDETVCPELPDPMVHERCLGYTAFRKALRANDPALCGESRFCRTLMGGGRDNCASYAGEIRRKACAFFARADLGERIASLLRDAQGKLSRAGYLAGAGLSSGDLGRREAKLERLQRRLVLQSRTTSSCYGAAPCP